MPTNSADANTIATDFRAAVDGGHLFEKTIYYKVERECLAALASANALDHVVFIHAAFLAEALARSLEDDAIDASHAVLWQRYAVELETVIRLAGAGQPSDIAIGQLAKSASIIYPPRNGL